MPGLRSTPSQAARLMGLDHATCDSVIEALVQERFLRRTSGLVGRVEPRPGSSPRHRRSPHSLGLHRPPRDGLHPCRTRGLVRHFCRYRPPLRDVAESAGQRRVMSAIQMSAWRSSSVKKNLPGAGREVRANGHAVTDPQTARAAGAVRRPPARTRTTPGLGVVALEVDGATVLATTTLSGAGSSGPDSGTTHARLARLDVDDLDGASRVGEKTSVRQGTMTLIVPMLPDADPTGALHSPNVATNDERRELPASRAWSRNASDPAIGRPSDNSPVGGCGDCCAGRRRAG